MSFLTPYLTGESSVAIGSLPLTMLIAALPHWYTISKAEANKVQGGWSNENPRAFVARLHAKAATGKKLTDLENMILRGQSAQQNGFEWWGMWAAAVILGTMAKLPREDMTRYTVIHVVCRLLFNYLYVTTKTRRMSYLRTIVFQVSLYPVVAIFLRAASIL